MIRGVCIWVTLALLALLEGVALAQPTAAWTATERWARVEITAGRIADLDVRCRAVAPPSARAAEARLPEAERLRRQEPALAEDGEDPWWREPCRKLSAAFVVAIMREVGAVQARTPSVVQIAGARITGNLDVGNERVPIAVGITHSRFDGRLRLDFARFEAWLSFDKSAFVEGIQAEGCE